MRPPPAELRKEITLSVYLVNSIRKFRFPYQEDQGLISIQSTDLEDQKLLESDWLKV